MPSSDRITFPGAQGHALAARFERADDEKAVALFAHCFSCGKDVFAASRIASALSERGISVLRFDFTGLGASEGDFGNTNFSSNVADLIAAADWLRAQGRAPAALIGHSLGGAAAVMAALAIPEVRAVVTIGAPAHADHVEAQLGPAVPEIEARGEAEVRLAGRPFRMTRAFLEDVRAARVLEAATQLKRALLILHSPLDHTVGVENAAMLFNAAKHPKSFVSLDGADHLLTGKADAIYAADVIAAWASRYLQIAAAPVSTDAVPLPAFPVVVEELGPKLRSRVQAGRHVALAGEPAAIGGDDAGMSPFQYVAAGLGACTSMTLRLYADRKEWPLEGVRVSVDHAKRTDPQPGQHADIFSREITLTGNLSDDQRARLLEIAEKCPVHRTLSAGAEIPTRLTGGQTPA